LIRGQVFPISDYLRNLLLIFSLTADR